MLALGPHPDPWYACSSSAFHDHLRGRRRVSVLAIVREVRSTGSSFVCRLTALAIGTGLPGVFDPAPDPPFYNGWLTEDDDDYEEDGDDDAI